MVARPIYIATEDVLSETVAERLVHESASDLQIAVRVRKNGNSYLKSKFPELLKTAAKIPVFLITDLDNIRCPVELIKSWTQNTPPPPGGMIMRVAVREIESWILADRDGFSEYTGIPVEKLALDADALSDPKRELLNLVKRYARKRIKESLLPSKGSSSKIGWEYNAVLCQFARSIWSVDRAVRHSNSLRRAVNRLSSL